MDVDPDHPSSTGTSKTSGFAPARVAPGVARSSLCLGFLVRCVERTGGSCPNGALIHRVRRLLGLAVSPDAMYTHSHEPLDSKTGLHHQGAGAAVEASSAARPTHRSGNTSFRPRPGSSSRKGPPRSNRSRPALGHRRPWPHARRRCGLQRGPLPVSRGKTVRAVSSTLARSTRCRVATLDQSRYLTRVS